MPILARAMRTTILALIGAAFSAAGAAEGERPMTASAPDAPAALRAKIDRLVQPLIGGHAALGLSVGIVDGDETYYLHYGSASTKRAEKPDAETVYEIGSITKVFTGILLADAVERKQVSLDDPVQKYL